MLRGQLGIVHIGSFMVGSVGHKSGTRGSSCSLHSAPIALALSQRPLHMRRWYKNRSASSTICLIEDDCSLIRAGRTFVAPHALNGTAYIFELAVRSLNPSLQSEIAPSPSTPRRSWAAAMAVPRADRSRPQARSPAATPRRSSWAATRVVPRPWKRRRRTRRRDGALASTRGGSISSWALQRPSWQRRGGG